MDLFLSARNWTYLYLTDSGPIFICQKVEVFYLQEKKPIFICEKVDLFYLPKSGPILSARKITYFMCQKVDLFFLPGDLFYQQERGLIELIACLVILHVFWCLSTFFKTFPKISFKNMISVNSLDTDDCTH